MFKSRIVFCHTEEPQALNQILKFICHHQQLPKSSSRVQTYAAVVSSQQTVNRQSTDRTERSFAITHRVPAHEGRPVRAPAEEPASRDRRTRSASAFLPALAWYSLPLLSSLLPHFRARRVKDPPHTHLLLPPGVCMCVWTREG